MHTLLVITMLTGACVAHYRGGFESRNLVQREEADGADGAGALVECPVCENSDALLPNQEKCNVIKGDKRYKRCERGTYVNEVCGSRIDCYRGPGDMCSEKMRFDEYGARCARGFYCNDVFHVCTGPGFAIDSNSLWVLNKVYRYPLRSQLDHASIKSDSAMVLT